MKLKSKTYKISFKELAEKLDLKGQIIWVTRGVNDTIEIEVGQEKKDELEGIKKEVEQLGSELQ
jgi:hypothetical protein